MKKVLTLLFFITAVLLTACAPKYEIVNGCEIRPETQCSKFALSGADLSEASLIDALYNEYTKFPEDFDPEEAGMVLEE